MKKIECEIEYGVDEGDTGEREITRAICPLCGHETWCYGTTDSSVRRCLATLREECPRGERNFYAAEEGCNDSMFF